MQTRTDLAAVSLSDDEVFESVAPLNALLVEDDEAWSYGIRRALLSCGISVQVVHDVSGARHCLRMSGEPVDIVLLNPVLWNGRGDELLTEIEALPRQPGVVILTNLVEEIGVYSSSYRLLLVSKKVEPRKLASIMRRAARGSAQETIERFAKRFRLTRRETEVLDGIASGVAPKEMAMSLGCSTQAIYALLGKISVKTHCATYQTVVAKLFQFSCHGLGHTQWHKLGGPCR
jgi:DNA-binding NarL/FixJ family response regulator